MKNKITLLMLITVMIGCTSSKMVKTSAAMSIPAYDARLHTEMTALTTTPTIPTCDVWLTDKNEFVTIIKGYISDNSTLNRKSTHTFNFFIITTAIIGVGGGIYGFVSDNEPKGAAITSLVSGALSALIGSLGSQKKAQRASQCATFLEQQRLSFEAYWGVARCPQDVDQLKAYMDAKDKIIEELKSMACFGVNNVTTN